MSGCGYVFCKVCLNKRRGLAKTNYSCPHCHNSEFPTFPHKEADRQIKALNIYCPNKNKGCQWIGKLSDVDKHIIDGKCHDVECDKCKEIIPYTTFIDHLTVCPCYCQHCETEAEKEIINSKHKDKCMYYPKLCPDCGKYIAHHDFAEHLNTCPDRIKKWYYILVLLTI